MFIVSMLVNHSDKENEMENRSLSEHTLSFINCRTYACKFGEKIIGKAMPKKPAQKKQEHVRLTTLSKIHFIRPTSYLNLEWIYVSGTRYKISSASMTRKKNSDL